jgi:hypothetical protein
MMVREGIRNQIPIGATVSLGSMEGYDVGNEELN